MTKTTKPVIDKLSDEWDDLRPVPVKEEKPSPAPTADKMTLFYDTF